MHNRLILLQGAPRIFIIHSRQEVLFVYYGWIYDILCITVHLHPFSEPFFPVRSGVFDGKDFSFAVIRATTYTTAPDPMISVVTASVTLPFDPRSRGDQLE